MIEVILALLTKLSDTPIGSGLIVIGAITVVKMSFSLARKMLQKWNVLKTETKVDDFLKEEGLKALEKGEADAIDLVNKQFGKKK